MRKRILLSVLGGTALAGATTAAAARTARARKVTRFYHDFMADLQCRAVRYCTLIEVANRDDIPSDVASEIIATVGLPSEIGSEDWRCTVEVTTQHNGKLTHLHFVITGAQDVLEYLQAKLQDTQNIKTSTPNIVQTNMGSELTFDLTVYNPMDSQVHKLREKLTS